MKFLKIPIYITFTNWLIIVVIGSLICPHMGELISDKSFIGGSRQSLEDTLGISLLCMIVSAACSLPALIVMFVAHLLLNRKQVSKKQHMTVQNMVHIGVSILTFGVMIILMGPRTSGRDMDFVWTLLLSYLPAGLLVWNITYALSKEKDAAQQTVKTGEMLDEF